MQSTTKQIIAAIVTIFLLFVAVYGSYMPMRKAETFISTLQGLQVTPPTSLNDLETRVSVPLDYPSPIGQEELVRNLANSVLGFVQNNPEPSSTAGLINFLGTYYNPIISRGKGMSFGQDLYILGVINEIAFTKTGDPTYLAAAKQYYSEGNALGPNRPQSLYGLFDVYRFAGDASDAETTAQRILTNWPSDTSVQQALAQILAASHSATTTTK
jgi:hypothetical protein